VSTGPDSTDPPGAVSNQNQEEAESAHADGGQGGRGVRPDKEAEGSAKDSAPGAAGEGSQATGHPDNAG
jgi:hypothetical protein